MHNVSSQQSQLSFQPKRRLHEPGDDRGSHIRGVLRQFSQHPICHPVADVIPAFTRSQFIGEVLSPQEKYMFTWRRKRLVDCGESHGDQGRIRGWTAGKIVIVGAFQVVQIWTDELQGPVFWTGDVVVPIVRRRCSRGVHSLQIAPSFRTHFQSLISAPLTRGPAGSGRPIA